MSEDRGLYEVAALGVEVQSWLNSPVGAALIERARQNQALALEQLATADPNDSERIRALQQQAQTPRLITDWLSAAVNDGLLAEAQLHELEVTEHE